MSNWKKHVLPHGPLRLIKPGLWEVTGMAAKGPVPRNMVVYRLPDQTLLLHSVVAMDDARMKELEALGKPSVMIVPSKIHRLDAGVYKERYPDIKVVCPAAARSNVEQVVKVDAVAEEYLPSRGVQCLKPAGLKDWELVYVLKTPSGKALVVTDCLMNLPNLGGIQGFFLKLLGSTGFFGITAIGRMLMMQDRARFKAWLGEIAGLADLEVISVAHGSIIVDKCAERLREARDRL